MSDEFHRDLIKPRQKYPHLVAQTYNTLQTNAVVRGAVTSTEICAIVAPLLGAEISGLSATGEMRRLDFPEDTRNALKWHQEQSYYPQNLDGNNGLAIWVLVEDTGPFNGSIQICSGSHRSKLIKVPSSEKQNNTGSEQYEIPKEYIARYS